RTDLRRYVAGTGRLRRTPSTGQHIEDRRRRAPSVGNPVARNTRSGLALWPAHAAQISRIHRRRHSHSRPRHRREYRDFVNGQRDFVASVALLSASAALCHSRIRPSVGILRPIASREWRKFSGWKNESHAFAAMTLIDSADGALLGMGRPHWLYGAAVTSDFFAILGVQPLMGHAFLPEDGAYGGKPEIILTHELWRNQFHSDPGILGKAVNLGGRALTIIGVLPANFFFPRMLA